MTLALHPPRSTLRPRQVRRFLLEPQADLAALRNLRRDTIAQEYSWVVDLLCKPGAPPGRREACAAAKAQWRGYELEQAAAGGGWAARAPVIEVSLPALPTSLPEPAIHLEQLCRTATPPPAPAAQPPSCAPLQGAFYVADLRSAATHCLLCAWFNEYVRFSERDQLSFAYVAMSLAAATRVHLIPRRLHWSVTVSKDTTACYGATEAGAATIASHHAHTRSDTGRRGWPSRH